MSPEQKQTELVPANLERAIPTNVTRLRAKGIPDNCILETFTISSVTPLLVKALAQRILTQRDVLLQEKPPIIVCGRECRQQRDVGFFSDEVEHYKYSGRAFPALPLTEELRVFLQAVNEACGAKFNGCLVNLYDTGQNYISEHSDNERELDKQAGVVALSIGATRVLRIKQRVELHNSKETRRSLIDVPLIHGTLVRMAGDFQRLLTHQVPKKASVTEWRMSVTCREHCG